MLFCGIDIGTSNTKAVVIDAEGELRGRITIPLGVESRKDEFPAAVWVDHFQKALNFLASQSRSDDQSLCVGITAQGGSMVLLDEEYQPISTAMSWTKLASDTILRELRGAVSFGDFYEKTGWLPDGWMGVCKVMELLRNNPKLKQKLKYIASVPDFVGAQVFGTFVTDVTQAQITGFYDFTQMDWISEILNRMGLTGENFAEVKSATEILRENFSLYSSRITLMSSSHDQYAVMRACGLNDDGFMLATGSAWVVNGKSKRPLYDGDCMIHPGRDLEGGFGYIISFEAIGKHFDELLIHLDVDYDLLAAMAEDIQKIEIPDQPIDTTTINSCSAKPEAIRRFMEATVARVRFVLEKKQLLAGIKKLLMTGGSVGNNLWPQFLADILNIPVDAVRFNELTAYGAALFSRTGMTGVTPPHRWPMGIAVTLYEPRTARKYDDWFYGKQVPLLEWGVNRD
ncbi:MAG: FGGY family carbohydrate kinase [Phycisphaerae bacterium]